jgi:hypothetical protein
MQRGAEEAMKLRWLTKRNLLGKLVVEIDQRGCMAEDHQFKRLGVIVGVEDQRVRLPTSQSMLQAKCRIVVSRETTEDEFFYVCIEDGSFQPDERVPYLMWWRH